MFSPLKAYFRVQYRVQMQMANFAGEAYVNKVTISILHLPKIFVSSAPRNVSQEAHPCLGM